GRLEIVFLDPPYALDLGEQALAALGAGALVAEDGVVVGQHFTKRPPAAEYGVLRAFRARRFGETALTFFRARGEPTALAKRAVYPGMFDPVHNGHVDVIQRSLQIFDELIVAVVANPGKQPLFSMKERLEMIDEATSQLSNFRIVAFDGLLIDLVARERAD